jgi:hypothetical protein
MRTLATMVLGALATLAFWVFFALHGAVSYVTDADAVTGTARKSDLHGMVLQAADLALAQEVDAASARNEDEGAQPDARDAAYRELVLAQARQVIAEALTQEWLYGAFAAGYGDVIAILEGGDSTRVKSIDLRQQKAGLGAGLATVAERVEEQCDRFHAAEDCKDPASRRRTMEPLRTAIARTMEQIADDTDIARVMGRADKDWLQADSRTLERARQALDLSRIACYVAAGALLALLFVIALIHAPPLSRALLAIGAVLAVASASYLAAVHIAGNVPQDLLAEQRVHERMATGVRDDAVGSLATRGAETLVLAAIDDALHASDRTVMAILIASLGATIGAAVLRSRR